MEPTPIRLESFGDDRFQCIEKLIYGSYLEDFALANQKIFKATEAFPRTMNLSKNFRVL